jgi:methylated-DNA-[protein]-cysteine S-methyltransferase
VTDIAVMTLAGPDGPLQIAASDRGIAAAEWWLDVDAFRAMVVRRLHGTVAEDGPTQRRLDAVRPVLEALIAGRRVDASKVELDLADRPAWDRAVLGAVRRIGWGETASYGEIARRIGEPGAARAVGQALGRNPIPIIIPCHRVLGSGHWIGGFSAYGGTTTKERLLELEGAYFVAPAPTLPGI